MATFYADSTSSVNGDGSIGSPFNTIAGLAFGSNDWFLKGQFDAGAGQFTSGNNATVRAWEGTPVLMSSGNLFSCATATGTVLFDGITFRKMGGDGSDGFNCQQMSGASAICTIRNCTFENFTTSIRATRTRTLVVENCRFIGNNSSYGIRGQAQLTNNCENWIIRGNTFDCGIDLELYVSDASCTTGSFNNLLIEDNRFERVSGSCGTSLLLRGGGMNATDYSAMASITGAGGGGGNLVRDAGSPVWPNWGVGTVLFLAGWSNIANFGTVTVTGGGGTRTVTVTNLGATLVNESNGIGKGCAVFDTARAFNNPVIRNNYIANRNETPMFGDCFINGVVEYNTVFNTVNLGTVAAAFEMFGCRNTLVQFNRVINMSGSVSVDSMGLFWDGACVDCIGYANYFENIRPSTSALNAGAAMANFFSQNCKHLASTAVNCIKGFWAGGIATTATLQNNVIMRCDEGITMNIQPAAGAIVIHSNLIKDNPTGLRDAGTATVNNNAWWNNTTDVLGSTAASKDANAVTTNPNTTTYGVPKTGSTLLTSNVNRGFVRDAEGKLGKAYIGAHSTTVGATERGVR